MVPLSLLLCAAKFWFVKGVKPVAVLHRPRIEIDEQSPDVGSDGIIVAADDVTFQNIHFYRASHSSYHAVIAVPKGGPWPDYVVEYEGLSLRDCTIEGGRYGAFLHVEDLVVDGCTFYDTYRDSLILAAVRGTTIIKNNNFIGEAYSGKKAILVEGGVEQPYVAGTINVESNTCTGKHNFFLFNHWGNVADTVALTIRHNSIDTIGSNAVTLYPAYVTDPGAFQKFSTILVQDNIVSNGGRAVYVDYDSYGSVGGSLKPVPATGQVVVRNTLSYANSGDSSDTTDPTGNFGFYDTGAETPPGASMAIFDLAGNLAGDPLYDDPSHANGDFVLQPGSPALGAASDGTNIGEWQGAYQATPTPTSTPTSTPTITPTPTESGPCSAALVMADLEGMHIGTVRAGGEDYYRYQATMAEEASEKYGYIYDINNEFIDQDDFGPAAIAIEVVSDAGPRSVQAGDFLTLSYDGTALDVHFPEITGYGSTRLYVGDDGSTYTDPTLCSVARAAPTSTPTTTPAQTTTPLAAGGKRNFPPRVDVPPAGYLA